jgi:hypothetical protein
MSNLIEKSKPYDLVLTRWAYCDDVIVGTLQIKDKENKEVVDICNTMENFKNPLSAGKYNIDLKSLDNAKISINQKMHNIPTSNSFIQYKENDMSDMIDGIIYVGNIEMFFIDSEVEDLNSSPFAIMKVKDFIKEYKVKDLIITNRGIEDE